MVERRHVIGGGVLGGLLGALGADAAEAGQSSSSNREEAQMITRAIDQLRTELRNQRIFSELAAIRDIQLRYLVANGKFPDFLEVGTDVWFQVHDWHVRWNQPLNLGRDIQNRPTILLMQTTIILRPELKEFIGIPYDNK
jgi:hypothetical protein